MKSAIVFGASGFVGSHLLSELLNNSDGQVTAMARKSLNITHPRLRTVIADYNSLPGVKSEIAADEVFIALFTAVDANPNSKFFYLRTKGETERDVIVLDFDHTHIFRPSMIMGIRKEKLEGNA